MTRDDLKKCSNLHNIPSSIIVNKNIQLDYRLMKSLTNPEKSIIKYDFDVYLPSYNIYLQRPYIWEHCQQNEFILSILLEKPIEPVVIVEHTDEGLGEKAIRYVIDGKQRLMTIQKFLYNEFPINVAGEEVFFKDFDDEMKRYFSSRVGSLTAYVYYSYWDNPVTDDMKIILFNYYNFAGTPQTEEHKNKLQSLLKK